MAALGLAGCGGSPAPSGTIGPTATTTATAATATAATATAAATAGDLHGVSFTLPAGWTVRPSGDDACVGPGNFCAVYVSVRSGPADLAEAAGSPVDVFRSLGRREPDGCPAGLPATKAYDSVMLSGRPAEHRTYTMNCPDRDRSEEQWTVLGYPLVQLSIEDADLTLTEAAHKMVAGVRLPAGSTEGRGVDYGTLTTASQQADGIHVQLDRAVYLTGGPDNGHAVSDNPATYPYVLPPDLQVEDNAMLCGDGLDPGRRTCTVVDVLHAVAQHNGDDVTVVADSAGRVTRLVWNYHP